MIVLTGVSELRARVGEALGTSSWVRVTQEDVDAFARLTGDQQWIHVDPVRAGASPFGGTVVHGFFTLALAPRLMAEVLDIAGFDFGVNYGLDRVRFPAPLPVGARLRASVLLDQVEDVGDATQLTLVVTFERERHDKPVCVAQWIGRYYPAAPPP